MIRIDAARFSKIVRAVASKNSPSNTGVATKVIGKDESPSARDHDVLRAQLVQKLSSAKKKSHDFKEEAPYIAIQEIMSWEFGDRFLNNPDFKQITKSIVTSISNSPVLSKHMDDLIASFTGDAE